MVGFVGGALGLCFEDVTQGFDNLVGSGAPGLGTGIHFLERVDDVFTVQGDVGLGEGCAVACIKSGVPLFVLVAEAYNDQIRLLDHRASADGVDLG